MIAIAAGYDGSIRIDTRVDTTGFNNGVSSMSGGLTRLKSTMGEIGTAIAAAFLPMTIAAATLKVIQFGAEGVKASNELTNAMAGLTSSVERQGRSLERAKSFLNEYVSDGLVPLTDAATAYKNLAARGYDDTQIQKVMTALKNSATYGRQSSLSIGEAVKSAAEGLKNENSILVDNAGVTKNVSKMWEEYAASIGTTSSNLTQQQKIQAEVNGILNETRYQTGDAAKVANSFSGQLAHLSYNFNELKVAVGDAIIPLAETVLPFINQCIEGFTILVQKVGAFISMITGKSVTATSKLASGTGTLSDSASDAAANEDKLASSISGAANAAKKALMSFDELDTLQGNLGSGGASTGALIDATETDNSLADASDALQSRLDEMDASIHGFAIKAKDDFHTVFQEVYAEALTPLVVPAPIFADLPIPVWDPVWGLVPPEVPAPDFPSLPIPVFDPVWGLLPPAVPMPIFPLLPNPVFKPVWNLAETLLPELAQVEEGFAGAKVFALTTFSELLAGAGVWADGMCEKAALTYENVTANLSAMAAAGKQQVTDFVTTTSQNVRQWGTNVMTVGYQTASNFIANAQAMATGAYASAANFINQSAKGFVSWGNNVLRVGANTAKSFAKTFVSGLKSAWDSFLSFCKATGEAVKGFFSDHSKEIMVVSAIGIGAIAVASALPTGGASFGALLALPMLADGAVIPPNQQFMAILGDQTHGRNLEAPESLIRQIFREENDTTEVLFVLRDILDAVRAGKVLMVDRKTLAQAVTAEQTAAARASGKTPIPV